MDRPQIIEAALFDFDGTLADTEVLGFELDRRAARSFGVELEDEDLLTVVGTSGVDSFPAVFHRHGLEVSYEQFLERREDGYQIYSHMLKKLNPGAKELLRNLQTRGIKLALVSTTDANKLLAALNRFGLTNVFDAIVSGDMPFTLKPSPEPYLQALSLLGADPSHTVVFEDSPSGVSSAKAANLYTFAYKGGAIPPVTQGEDEDIDTFVGFTL